MFAMPVQRPFFKLSLLTLACFLTIHQAASARQMLLPHTTAKTTLTENITLAGMTEYKLDNELTIVLVPDASKPTTTVNITYQVGSRHEHYGETGMAHLLEHLLFKGTPSIPNLPQELSSRGMRPNGTTWYDRTNYFESFAASDEKLEWALKMEADRMVNAFIAKKHLDSEMTVVRNEMESGENDPQRILTQKMAAMAYQWHNYGKSTIGARSDVENVSIDHLRAFYQTYYQPDNAVLVVAGAFNPKKTIEWIKQYFGKIPRPTRKLPNTYTEEPAQDGERFLQLRRVGSSQSIGLLYRIPAATHPDFPAIEVALEMLTSTPSGRLYKSLVETEKAADIGAYAFPLKEPGYAIFSAELRETTPLEDTQKHFIQTVEQLATQPFQETELVRAKRILMNQWNQVLRDPQKLGVALSQAIAIGDWRMFLLNRERMEKVSLNDVNRVVQQYFKPINRTLGVFTPTQHPDRAEIPASPPLDKQLAGFKPSIVIQQGEAFEASYENIQQRVHAYQLKNGAHLNILPKKNRGETVNLYAQIHWGNTDTLTNQHQVGDLLGSMLMRGTKRLDHKALTDEFAKLNATISINSDIDGLILSVETTRPNLSEVIKLVGELLKSPRFDDADWKVLKQQALAELETQKTEPSVWASTELARYQQPYASSHPLYTQHIDEAFQNLSTLELSTLKNFYATHINTQFSEWSLVGDAPLEESKQQLEEAIGNWKTEATYTRLDRKVYNAPAKILTKSIPDKANALLQGQLLFAMQDTHPDYPALVAANVLLGGGFLNSKLATRIRQKEGISYGVGSYLKTSSDEPYTEWRIYALFAPQNQARLLQAIREELTKMQQETIAPEELKKALEGWLESRKLMRNQDSKLAPQLAEWTRLKRSPAQIKALEDQVRKVTPAQVQAAVQKYLKPNEWVFSLAGTFPANK